VALHPVKLLSRYSLLCLGLSMPRHGRPERSTRAPLLQKKGGCTNVPVRVMLVLGIAVQLACLALGFVAETETGESALPHAVRSLVGQGHAQVIFPADVHSGLRRIRQDDAMQSGQTRLRESPPERSLVGPLDLGWELVVALSPAATTILPTISLRTSGAHPT
jgi:hypothetical protein